MGLWRLAAHDNDRRALRQRAHQTHDTGGRGVEVVEHDHGFRRGDGIGRDRRFDGSFLSQLADDFHERRFVQIIRVA